jgi:hypothetical protein
MIIDFANLIPVNRGMFLLGKNCDVSSITMLQMVKINVGDLSGNCSHLSQTLDGVERSGSSTDNDNAFP